MNFSNWTIVTAGLGHQNFIDAASRVANQAKVAGFPNIFVLDSGNIDANCPKLLMRYPDIFSSKIPGFGYWSYKPEIVLTFLSQPNNSNRGVIWVDGGCELNMNPFTRLRMRFYMNIAKVQGAVVFSLNTPERLFTKRKVLNLFPALSPRKMRNQIQATWFMLYGKKGEAIAQKWLDIVLNDLEFIDSSFEPHLEDIDFVAPRNDQSIFSLICKEAGVIPLFYPPTNGVGGITTRIRSIFHPIWVSRNRSGETLIPARYLSIFSLRRQ